jgi:hypothetical protein
MANSQRPLSNLNPSRSGFDSDGVDNLSFPATADSWTQPDVAPHTMVIFSYEQKAFSQSVSDAASNFSGDIGTAISDFIKAAGDSGGIGQTADNILNSGSTRFFDFLNARDTRMFSKQLRSAFTFYMPNPVIYPLKNEYEEMKLMETIGGNLGSFVSTSMKVGLITSLAGAAGEGSAYAGYPINPKVEVIFRNIMQRVFEFTFNFYPASAAETEALRKTLIKLRHDASPKRLFSNGLVWQAPNTFDILLLHKGLENNQVPRIAECVCEEIEINYTPTNTGWVTFKNGHPVATTLRIVFREREPLDRENIIQNGY